MEREHIILADMPELFVTLLELEHEHGLIMVAEAARITSRPFSIKGTSSGMVRAVVPGMVFCDQLDSIPI